MSLDTLHIEASVPHYQAKLQKSMNRFFSTLPEDKPVTRNNVSIPHVSSANTLTLIVQYFIQLDNGLHWSHRMGEKYSDNIACTSHTPLRGIRVLN